MARARSPIRVIVRLLDARQESRIAELLVGPSTTVLNIKIQVEGIEGTPADNQTLLLGGRVLEDGLSLLDAGAVPERIKHSDGMVDTVTLTLVRCVPLLSGRLGRMDVRRLLEEDGALERAIDAFKDDPEYSASEVVSIVLAVARAVVPENPQLPEQILSNLPLDLLVVGGGPPPLPPSFSAAEAACVPPVFPAAAFNSKDIPLDFADWSETPTSLAEFSDEPELQQGITSTAKVYDIGGERGNKTRRERRDRFVECVRASLEVVRLVMEEPVFFADDVLQEVGK